VNRWIRTASGLLFAATMYLILEEAIHSIPGLTAQAAAILPHQVYGAGCRILGDITSSLSTARRFPWIYRTC